MKKISTAIFISLLSLIITTGSALCAANEPSKEFLNKTIWAKPHLKIPAYSIKTTLSKALFVLKKQGYKVSWDKTKTNKWLLTAKLARMNDLTGEEDIESLLKFVFQDTKDKIIIVAGAKNNKVLKGNNLSIICSFTFDNVNSEYERLTK